MLHLFNARPRRWRATPWRPLTDEEYAALRTYTERRPGPGRPLRDPRGRLDAIFAICLTDIPWSRIETDHGPTATIHRHFRRLAHQGVWTDLLRASRRRRAPRAIRRLRDWICALHRRCIRLLGLPAVALARRLHAFRALPGPCWYFPDPDLSESLQPVLEGAIERDDLPLVRLVARVLRAAGRRRPLPATLRFVG